MASPSATSSVHKTRYLIGDNHGWVLAALRQRCPVFSPHPFAAIRNGLAWASLTVALEKRRQLLELHHDNPAFARLTILEASYTQPNPFAAALCGVRIIPDD